MAIIKNFSLNKLPTKPNLGSFSNKPGRSGITSISREIKSTSAFRQFGDAVSRTGARDRSDKIYTSINSAIKNKAKLNKDSGTKPKQLQSKDFQPTVK